ncbi:hypothetical protein [Streptomyces canus]|uniref:hypothetical protein n=1 Tax=Streptomyces canus TaxID=58343 RepID=UPI002E295FF3|nr:hypothetical protein [Streptomyces canus]
MTAPLSRRTALRRAAFIAAGTVAGSQLLATPGYAASPTPDPAKLREAVRRAQERAQQREDHVLAGTVSHNGWDMEKVADDRGNIYTRPVPGTPLDVRVRMGDVETVLVHVIRRFHYDIDALGVRGEPRPVEGWVPPSEIHDSRHPESNLASGTAVVVRPGSYPLGARGGFTDAEELLVRDILADCEGIVRWGGSDRRPYEGLFYLNVKPGDPRLAKVASKLRDWDGAPGQGAGVLVDMTQPSRRRRATRAA